MLPLVYSMTSPRHPVKQEIFETDVGSCVTSLKKNLQNIRAMDKACLEMAQPNGLRYALQSAPWHLTKHLMTFVSPKSFSALN